LTCGQVGAVAPPPVSYFPCYHGVLQQEPAGVPWGKYILVIIKLLFLLVFMLVGASFAIINDAPVVVDLYFIRPELPLSLLLLLALGCGILLGGLAGVVYFMRVKRENADLKRKARVVSEEVKNLRGMPTTGR
jgi:putative membrane protein